MKTTDDTRDPHITDIKLLPGGLAVLAGHDVKVFTTAVRIAIQETSIGYLAFRNQ